LAAEEVPNSRLSLLHQWSSTGTPPKMAPSGPASVSASEPVSTKVYLRRLVRAARRRRRAAGLGGLDAHGAPRAAGDRERAVAAGDASGGAEGRVHHHRRAGDGLAAVEHATGERPGRPQRQGERTVEAGGRSRSTCRVDSGSPRAMAVTEAERPVSGPHQEPATPEDASRGQVELRSPRR
jgi:hypothetical protein